MNVEQEIALILARADEYKKVSELGDPDHHVKVSKMYLALTAATLFRAAEVLEEVTTPSALADDPTVWTP